MVIAMYMVYKTLDWSEALGVILPKVGPTDSAFIIIVDFLLCLGSIATVREIIPKPPINCPKDLQNIIKLGKLSTSLAIVAPVVEKPATNSKKASKNVLKSPG